MSNLSRKLMGISSAGASGESYWINLLGGTGSDIAYDVAIDSSDNIIMVGSTTSDGAGNNDCLIAKYTSSGTLLWDKTLGGSSVDIAYGVAVDSSDNIIMVGYVRLSVFSNPDLLVAKYNTSGTLLWAKALGGGPEDSAQGVSVDSSDNIIVVGYTLSDGAGGPDFLIAKYNTSGTLLWDKTLGGPGSEFAYGVDVDSSDNIVVVGGGTSDGAGNYDFFIAKYNSSGTLLWDKTLGGSSAEFGYGVAVDSSDNIVVVGYTLSDGAGSNDFLIAKYNSSGTLLWDKTLGGTGSDTANSVSIDSFDNIVVVGSTASDGAGSNDFLVTKYNSSGTLLWDKTLGGTGSDTANSVSIDSFDNIVVVGSTASDGAGSNDCLIAKLPTDGSGDGTYGNLIYQDAVLTDADAVLTDALAVLTSADAVLTDSVVVLTDAAAVLTSEFFLITP